MAQAVEHLPMGGDRAMPVPVACSRAVAAAGLAVTCGQGPLDGQGRVLSPGDAAAQAQHVAAAASATLAALSQPHTAALVVLYHTAEDAGTVAAPFRDRFPEAAIALIRLPHFHHDGICVEADLYALAWELRPRPRRLSNGPAVMESTGGEPLAFNVLTAPDLPAAEGLLRRLNPATMLAVQWHAAGETPAAWTPDPSAVARRPEALGLTAVMITSQVPAVQTRTAGGGVMRQAGGFAWVSGTGADADLAVAAGQAMDALALPADLTPLKATTHYAGGPGPDDLHRTLAVRHARFPRPGPASTGVPVAGLAGGRIAVDMLCAVDSSAPQA